MCIVNAFIYELLSIYLTPSANGIKKIQTTWIHICSRLCQL